LLRKVKDAGALIAIERPGMGASVGDKPGTAAKVISHGDFLPSCRLGSRSHSRKRFAI
jgi:hypothetical protein